jgi:hypothetical protein
LTDLKGLLPESWLCIDCGRNTAPGTLNRVEMEHAMDAATAAGDPEGSVQVRIDAECEIYQVRDAVWKAAGMGDGCLCIGCLEKRLGRQLRPKDFQHDHPFNQMPVGTARLRKRRK